MRILRAHGNYLRGARIYAPPSSRRHLRRRVELRVKGSQRPQFPHQNGLPLPARRLRVERPGQMLSPVIEAILERPNFFGVEFDCRFRGHLLSHAAPPHRSISALSYRLATAIRSRSLFVATAFTAAMTRASVS